MRADSLKEKRIGGQQKCFDSDIIPSDSSCTSSSGFVIDSFRFMSFYYHAGASGFGV